MRTLERGVARDWLAREGNHHPSTTGLAADCGMTSGPRTRAARRAGRGDGCLSLSSPTAYFLPLPLCVSVSPLSSSSFPSSLSPDCMLLGFRLNWHSKRVPMRSH
eukprot:1874461-Pyramimonas_sp.AAC.1